MKSFKTFYESVNTADRKPENYVDADGKTRTRMVPVKKDIISTEEKDPCWDTHKQVGMKKKNGKDVPNCVPKESVDEAVNESFKKGDTVKIKNVKSYDVFAKNDTGTVIGMNAGKVQVKVGTGSMNVDPKDLVAEAKMTQAQQDAFAKKIGDEQRAKERSKKVSSMGAYKGRRFRKEEVVNEATTKFNSIGDFEKAAKEKGYTTTDDKKRGFVNAFKGTTSVGRYDFNKSQGFLKENYGVMGKRAFKRNEHEFEAERERKAAAKRAQSASEPHHLYINKKVWKKNGKPVAFDNKRHANNVGLSLLKKDPTKDIKVAHHSLHTANGDTLK